MRKGKGESKVGGARAMVDLDLDGRGEANPDSGSGFLDHMLSALARMSGIDISAKAEGGIAAQRARALGLALGAALAAALGDKKGIKRYGWAAVPMDEALVEAYIEISGRPVFVIHGGDVFHGKAGDLDLELVPEFFRAVAFNADITMHLTVCASGNGHHLAEACFKAFARALREAVAVTGTDIPSTKARL